MSEAIAQPVPTSAAPSVAPAPASSQPAQPSMKQRMLAGAAWSMGGQLALQALRLGSNLILTRLLAPQAFGIMSLVLVIMMGVETFSSIGTRHSVVQHKRGDDPKFLHTAFTIQASRGFLVWLIICLMSWPAAWFYNEPMLLQLLPVVGLASLISGFDSMAKTQLIRDVRPGKTIAFEVMADVVALVVTAALAYTFRSVWALVGGAVARAAFRTATTYVLIPGFQNRFGYDRDAAKEMFRFGKWVIISTALMFLLTQADRLVLGRLLSLEDLGIYSVAILMVLAVENALKQVAANVVFPVYSHYARKNRQELREKTRRVRTRLMPVFLFGALVMAIAGEWIVRLLWPPNFHDAGWMLEVLAVGLAGRLIMISADGVLLAQGDSASLAILQVGRVLLLANGMAWGLMLGGNLLGMLVGMSVARFLEYPLLATLIRPYGVWLPKLDVAAIAGFLALVGLGWWLTNPNFLPGL